MLMVLYSTGMRNAELRQLQVADIDSRRMLTHIQRGKGGRDRYVPLSPRTDESSDALRVRHALAPSGTCVPAPDGRPARDPSRDSTPARCADLQVNSHHRKLTGRAAWNIFDVLARKWRCFRMRGVIGSLLVEIWKIPIRGPFNVGLIAGLLLLRASANTFS
jgi:integrase